MQKMNIWMKRERKLDRSEHGKEVHFCEPEEGSILGEDDDDDDGMMECLEQHKEEMSMTSSEEGNCNVFQTNCLCECEIAGTKDQANGAEQMQEMEEEVAIQENQDYAYEGQQEVVDSEVEQFQGTDLEEGSSASCQEDNLEEGCEGARLKFHNFVKGRIKWEV
jgi:hypothetical protein